MNAEHCAIPGHLLMQCPRDGTERATRVSPLLFSLKFPQSIIIY